jgi:hypothetical protein
LSPASFLGALLTIRRTLRGSSPQRSAGCCSRGSSGDYSRGPARQTACRVRTITPSKSLYLAMRQSCPKRPQVEGRRPVCAYLSSERFFASLAHVRGSDASQHVLHATSDGLALENLDFQMMCFAMQTPELTTLFWFSSASFLHAWSRYLSFPNSPSSHEEKRYNNGAGRVFNGTKPFPGMKKNRSDDGTTVALNLFLLMTVPRG